MHAWLSKDPHTEDMMRPSRVTVKLSFLLLTSITVSGVIVFSGSFISHTSLAWLGESFQGPRHWATFTLETKTSYRPKISGNNKVSNGEDSEAFHRTLETDTFRPKSLGDLRPSVDDRNNTLEMDTYRYLHKPETLSRTYDVWRAQRQRTQVLREACRGGAPARGLETAAPPGHLLVDDRNGFLFCQVRKVSSIAWRRVLEAVSSANSSEAGAGRLRRLSTYSPRQRERRLRDYTKFMFVREPMLRLVSGWRDKFVAGPQRGDYHGSWGPRIRRYNSDRNLSSITPRNRSNRRGFSLPSVQDNITLVEFVRYLTSESPPSPLLRDMHWEPYHSRCHPCRVRYDFVGHYETLSPDAAAIVGLLDRQRGGGHPAVVFPVVRSSSVTVARDEFPKLAPEDVARLAQIYDVDYKLFGYSMDRFMTWLLADKF